MQWTATPPSSVRFRPRPPYLLVFIFALIILSCLAQTCNAKGAISNELIQAVDSRNKHKVIALLKNGRNPNIRGFLNITPLMRASYLGDVEIANILVKTGADVNAIDIAGTSALHIAAKRGHADIINFLIQKGAVRFTDSEGYTPLMRAILYKHHHAAVALINTGSRVDFIAPNGLSILQMAKNNHDAQLVSLIESRLEDFKKLKEKALQHKKNAIAKVEGEQNEMKSTKEPEKQSEAQIGTNLPSKSKPKFEKLPWLSGIESMRTANTILEYKTEIKDNTKQVIIKERKEDENTKPKYIRMRNEIKLDENVVKNPIKANTKKNIKVGEAIPIKDITELENLNLTPPVSQKSNNIELEENIVNITIGTAKEAAEIVNIIKNNPQYSHLKLKTSITKVDGSKKVLIKINDFLDLDESFALCEILLDEYNNLACDIN